MKKRAVGMMLVAIAGLAATAAATPLPAGSSVGSASYTVSAPPGALVADSGFLAWGVVGFSGTIRSQVYDHGAGLTFAYTITVDGLPNEVLERFSTQNANWGTISDVGSDGVGVDPFELTRSVFGGSLGANFDATGSPAHLFPGETSTNFWFKTSATTYRMGDVFFQDGINTSGHAFIAIPLPSAGLMGLAGMGLVAVRRRR